MVIDLIGTNVKVDVVGITGYKLMGRIYHLLNFMMEYYENYITKKVDPKKLISNKEDTLFDDINDEEIEQELNIQDQVEAIGEIMDELFEPSQPSIGEQSQEDPSSDSSSSSVLRLDEELSDSELPSDEELPESVLSG